DGRESRIPRDQAGEARTLARALLPEFAGSPDGQGRRIAVVVSRFNEAITQRLVDGAMDALTRHGVAYDDIDVVWVPGAWELRDAALRRGGGRVDARAGVGRIGVRHAGYVRRVDVRHDGAGGGARRRGTWEQGMGCRDRGARDGEPARPVERGG